MVKIGSETTLILLTLSLRWVVVDWSHFHVTPNFWVELRLSLGCDNIEPNIKPNQIFNRMRKIFYIPQIQGGHNCPCAQFFFFELKQFQNFFGFKIFLDPKFFGIKHFLDENFFDVDFCYLAVCVGKKKKCLCCVAFSKGSRPTKITKIVGKAQK